jgi:CRISPR-associated endonuclease/helicase Cas3
VKAAEGPQLTPFSRVFWGKLKEGFQLPLSQHCLDVAMVFQTMASLPLVRRRLEAAAGNCLEDRQLDRLAVISFLHDIGKANLGFQDRPFDPKAPRAGHIRELAPLLFEADLCKGLSKAMKVDMLACWFDSKEGLERFLIAAWSHHGAPVRFDESERTGNYYPAKTRWWRSDGTRDPMAEIATLMNIAQVAFPSAFESDVEPLPTTPQLQHQFAGLLMLADWLGSHEAFFPIARQADDPVGFSCQAAKKAVRDVGLMSAPYQNVLAARPEAGFSEWFGIKPRPLQTAVNSLALHNPEHQLLIAEAETGSGKTEAALARFFRLFRAGEVDALYFALPTRVAAREIYGRVCGYVERVFPDQTLRPHVLLAVPRYAQVDRVAISTILPDEMTTQNTSTDIPFGQPSTPSVSWPPRLPWAPLIRPSFPFSRPGTPTYAPFAWTGVSSWSMKCMHPTLTCAGCSRLCLPTMLG